MHSLFATVLSWVWLFVCLSDCLSVCLCVSTVWRCQLDRSLYKLQIVIQYCISSNRHNFTTIQFSFFSVWAIFERFDWSFAHIVAPVVTTSSIVFSFNKSRIIDILVPASPRPLGKLAVKRERELRIIMVIAATTASCRFRAWVPCGCRVDRIDQICLRTRCCKRRQNQALSILCLILGECVLY